MLNKIIHGALGMGMMASAVALGGCSQNSANAATTDARKKTAVTPGNSGGTPTPTPTATPTPTPTPSPTPTSAPATSGLVLSEGDSISIFWAGNHTGIYAS